MANMTNNRSIKNGKPGSSSVGTGKGERGMAGDAGKSMPVRAFQGPKSPGQPPAMKKALAKKSPKGDMTGFAGLVR
jgi:hypothetical protein